MRTAPAEVAPAGSGAGGTAPPLENTANNVTTPLRPAETQRDRRWLRWDQRADLWKLSSLQRCRHCGRVARSTATGITLRAVEGEASWAGLQHCGSVWACPVCGAIIRAHRALDVGAVLSAAIGDGCWLIFGTLTMRHRQGQSLGLLWDAAQPAWRQAAGAGAFRREFRRVEGVGWVRVWEVSYGRNGWHVHPHWVLVGRGGAERDAIAVCEAMYGRWARQLQRSGLEAPLMVGQDWHRVTGERAGGELSEYLFKLAEAPEAAAGALGVELTHTLPGRAAGRLSTAPVLSLLDGARLDGDAEALDRWHEWERGSKGRRQIGWGGDLRKLYGQADELSDEAIVDQDHGGESVLELGLDAWRVLVSLDRGRAPAEVLRGWQAGGRAGAAAVLDRLGIGYRMVSK